MEEPGLESGSLDPEPAPLSTALYWEKGPQLQSQPHPGVMPTTAWLPGLGRVTVFSVIWLPTQDGEKEACQSDGLGMREGGGRGLWRTVALGMLLSPPSDGRFL